MPTTSVSSVVAATSSAQPVYSIHRSSAGRIVKPSKSPRRQKRSSFRAKTIANDRETTTTALDETASRPSRALQIRPRHQARTSASDAVSCSTLESGISTENPANASDTPALETCTKAVSRAPPLLLGFPLCPPFLQGRVNDVEVWLRNPARVALGEELTFAT